MQTNYIYTEPDGLKCRAVQRAGKRPTLLLDNGDELMRSEYKDAHLSDGPELVERHEWSRDELHYLAAWMRNNGWDDEFRSLRWLEKPNAYIDIAWLAGCDVEVCSDD